MRDVNLEKLKYKPAELPSGAGVDNGSDVSWLAFVDWDVSFNVVSEEFRVATCCEIFYIAIRTRYQLRRPRSCSILY